MTSFFAAATQFFKRNSWSSTPWTPPELDDRHGSIPGARQCPKLQPQALSLPGRLGPTHSFASASDGTSRHTQPANMSSWYALSDATENSFVCQSPGCDHSCCSPPRLVYSPASSSSIALETPPPSTPLSPELLAADYPLLSLTGCHPADEKPLSSIQAQLGAPKAGPTLAERRGVKALALQGAPTLSDVPKSKLLSPRTPDSASSFAQRLVGFMRPSTPTPESDPVSPEYGDDPFGGAAPSFFDNPYFFDAAPVRPHPDLYDLAVYRPRTHHHVKKSAKHSRARLYVGVSDLQPDSDAAAPVSHPRSAPSLDLRPASAPITLLPPSPPAHSVPISADSHRLSVAALSPSPPPSTSPNLRPLLLPQKFARREIADAQSSSILQHAAPKLRPLILPQELARRASHPSRRSWSRTATTLSPFAPGRPTHRRAFSTSTAMSITSVTGPGPEDQPDGVATYSDMTRKDQRRSQQLDDLLCLLGESGVLGRIREADEEQPAGTAPSDSDSGSDSDSSAGVTTPPSVLSSPNSSSPYSFINAPQEGVAGEVGEKPGGESRNLEDILELLEISQEEAADKTDPELVADEGAADESICAYAM